MPDGPDLPDGPDDVARALRDPGVRQRRRAMLALPHMAPLAAYSQELRAHGQVPDFDPLDGGTAATILFLFEKPGPMTDATRAGRPGSGFVSRDSDDPTAEATRRFMQDAGIARAETIIWNIVPWWNGAIAVTGAERRRGLAELPRLLALLPRLRGAVLVGRTAAAAAPRLARLPVVRSPHPSPQVRAANRGLWDGIPAIWRQAVRGR